VKININDIALRK